METLKHYGKAFVEIFGFTDALGKEHAIQWTIFKATLLNTVILALTYWVHEAVLEDLTLRVYFEKDDTKKRCALASILNGAIWFYLVKTQRSHIHIQPTMALYTLCFYIFTTVLNNGAYSAAELHIVPG